MYRAIQYNYLNQPASISATKDDGGHKGDIKYVYDAAGNKLQKIVLDYTAFANNYITQTDYIGPQSGASISSLGKCMATCALL